MTFRKGNVPWNKGLRGKEYLKHYGGTHPMKGKKHWDDKPHPRGFKGKKRTQKELKQMSKRMMGKKNPMSGVKLEKNVRRMKENNPMWNPESARKSREKTQRIQKEKMKDEKQKEAFVKRIRSGLKKPTKPERQMKEIIKRNNLPFNYVGNGGIWFRGYGTLFNPDFLSKSPKHIIEVFGDYWHNLPERKKLDKKRIKTYSKYGYQTLVVWEYELRNPTQVLNKIKEFIKK